MRKIKLSPILTCLTIQLPIHFFIPKSQSQDVQSHFPSYKGRPQFPIYPFLTLHLLGILLIVTCALATNLAPPCFEPQDKEINFATLRLDGRKLHGFVTVGIFQDSNGCLQLEGLVLVQAETLAQRKWKLLLPSSCAMLFARTARLKPGTADQNGGSTGLPFLHCRCFACFFAS